MRTTPLLAAVAATALAAPAAAHADFDAQPNPVTTGPIPQYAAPFPVANDDQSFTLQPNTTQTFTARLADLGGGTRHLLAPCFGFELSGPDVSVAEAMLPLSGVMPDSPALHDGTWDGLGSQDANGDYTLPQPPAGVDPHAQAEAAKCQGIGWSFYVDPATGRAARAASKKARKTGRPVKVAIKSTKKARKADVDDASAQVLSASLNQTRNASGTFSSAIIVTIKTGDLSGPTTLTTRARVLLQD
jgi:hypothetical protein